MVAVLKKYDYTFFSFDSTYLMVRCTFVSTDLRVVEAKAQTERQTDCQREILKQLKTTFCVEEMI